MKLTIERGALLKALSHAQSVVERRTTIPILANVLLQVEDGALRLSATDMDLGIIETVEAGIASAGAITAPAHTLYDIARKLPEGAQVEIESSGDDGRLRVRCNSAGICPDRPRRGRRRSTAAARRSPCVPRRGISRGAWRGW